MVKLLQYAFTSSFSENKNKSWAQSTKYTGLRMRWTTKWMLHSEYKIKVYDFSDGKPGFMSLFFVLVKTVSRSNQHK